MSLPVNEADRKQTGIHLVQKINTFQKANEAEWPEIIDNFSQSEFVTALDMGNNFLLIDVRQILLFPGFQQFLIIQSLKSLNISSLFWAE